MWRIPYFWFLILVLSPSWYWTMGFGFLCAALVFLVMCVACRLRLRMVAKAIRARSDERLDQQTRTAHELYDTMLQTVEGSKFVTDAALDKSNDPAYMRSTLEKLSMWLGQATQEGQAALHSLRSATTDSNNPSKSKK